MKVGGKVIKVLIELGDDKIDDIAEVLGMTGKSADEVAAELRRLEELAKNGDAAAKEMLEFIGRVADDVGDEIRQLNIKGWKKGKQATHFADHGAEMGFQTGKQYTDAAIALAKKSEGVLETKVGNTLFKFDKSTGNILIVNAKDRVIKTFYKSSNGIQSFKEAMEAHLKVLQSQQ